MVGLKAFVTRAEQITRRVPRNSYQGARNGFYVGGSFRAMKRIA